MQTRSDLRSWVFNVSVKKLAGYFAPTNIDEAASRAAVVILWLASVNTKI